jgi:hypothetical protein
MAVTGHKSVSSLAIYQRTFDKRKEEMLAALAETIRGSQLVPYTPPQAPNTYPAACPLRRPAPATVTLTMLQAQSESRVVTSQVTQQLDIDDDQLVPLLDEFQVPAQQPPLQIPPKCSLTAR